MSVNADTAFFCRHKKKRFRKVKFVKTAGIGGNSGKIHCKNTFLLKNRQSGETNTYHFSGKCRRFVKCATKVEKNQAEIVMKID